MHTLNEMSTKSEAAEKLTHRNRKAAHAAAHEGPSTEPLIAELAPGAASRLAANAEDLTRRGIERARSTANEMRGAALRAGDAAADRIRDDPLKSVLAAAAAGAAATLIVRWLVGRGKAD